MNSEPGPARQPAPRRRSRAAGAMEDFRALDPFFRIIEDGLRNYTDDEHFFDLLAEDVVFDFVITVPAYPPHIAGRDDLIELFRGCGRSFFLDSCDDLRVHHDPDTSPAPCAGYRRMAVTRTSGVTRCCR